MSRLFHAVTGLLCILALPATLVLAQDTCPATATCYEGHELEFDKADGYVQALVVKTTVTTTTNLDGQQTTETVTLAIFASNGDTYDLVDTLTYPKSGELATADLGETFAFREIAP